MGGPGNGGDANLTAHLIEAWRAAQGLDGRGSGLEGIDQGEVGDCLEIKAVASDQGGLWFSAVEAVSASMALIFRVEHRMMAVLMTRLSMGSSVNNSSIRSEQVRWSGNYRKHRTSSLSTIE